MSETDPVSLPLPLPLPLPLGEGRGEGQRLAQTAGLFAVTSLVWQTAAAFVVMQALQKSQRMSQSLKNAKSKRFKPLALSRQHFFAIDKVATGVGSTKAVKALKTRSAACVEQTQPV